MSSETNKPVRSAGPSSLSSRAVKSYESMLVRPVLYPNVYVWYLLLAALDIMLTAVIVGAGGFEINTLADRVMIRWGMPGLVIFKFSLVVLVVAICEIVGRKKDRTGRKLAEWAVAITAIPVVVSLLQLVVVIYALNFG